MNSHQLQPPFNAPNYPKYQKRYFYDEYTQINTSKEQIDKKISTQNLSSYKKLRNPPTVRVIEPEYAKTPTFRGKKTNYQLQTEEMPNDRLHPHNLKKFVNMQTEFQTKHGFIRDRSLTTKDVTSQDIIHNLASGIVQNPYRRVKVTADSGYDNGIGYLISHSFFDENKRAQTPVRKKS